MSDWAEAAARYNVEIHCSGLTCLPHFAFVQYPLELKTLYTVLMLQEGFLGNTAVYPTLAHNDEILEKHRIAIDHVFKKIADILKQGTRQAILDAIGGPVCQTGFARLLK